MTDQQSPIAPPPSLGDILGRSERVGTVDFSHRLAPEPPAPAEETESPADQAPADQAPADQAPTDQAPTDQEQPAPGTEPTPETGPAPRTSPQASPESDLETDPHLETGTEPGTETGPGTHLDPGHRPPSAAYDAAVPTHAPRDPEDPMTPSYADPARLDDSQVAALLSLVPAEDLATVGESFEDVVDAVLGRIRAAETATIRHLAAVEEEAARRCEMVTAQAELDAELIRLHARREAHAIIAASRLRAGEPIKPTSEEMGLHQLGDAAGRLAEKLESSGDTPGTPDHPFLR